jgi:1-acyl-sn-glycerol-3-phosphate acyltransferase
MSEKEFEIAYPRRRLARGLCRVAGRLLLPAFFEIDIIGQENFPAGGPLLVVGNHVAAMEVVLMAVFTPWQVEFLGSSDIPHERVTECIIRIFGSIPFQRGSFNRSALAMALDVLAQGGVVGVFPEGGIWDAGAMRAQAGVAWLSYYGRAPVLPIGFGGTPGAMGAALRLKRPRLRMQVGEPIAAARISAGKPRRACLDEHAELVMRRVRELIPERYASPSPQILNERFILELRARAADGRLIDPPLEICITQGDALARLLHSAPVLKVFSANLRLPVEALQRLHTHPGSAEIAGAATAILDYLRKENPYFLAYRFGPKIGADMREGLQQLHKLASWAAGEEYMLEVVPLRRFYSVEEGREVEETQQGSFVRWM